jgi:hypothetical protein
MIKRICTMCGKENEIFEDGEEDVENFICGECNINPSHRTIKSINLI